MNDPAASMTDMLELDAEHHAARAAVIEKLLAARNVVLTTHVNADGDGTGSQAALAAWLEERGAAVSIVNPTPFPAGYRFLLHRPDLVLDVEGKAAQSAFASADLFVVLDASESKRLGPLRDRFRTDRIVVIDHHPAGDHEVGDTVYRDTSAAATGEMIFDLLRQADPGAEVWPEATAQGIYVAMVTDTGSFRYSNTHVRTHLIAADMLRRGIEPEKVYRQVYASVPMRRIRLLREALGAVEMEEEAGISWMIVDNEMTRRAGALPDDYEGLVEQLRSIEGTEVAILFRETPEGRTKVSLRSNGDADVSKLARKFGGGGHVKASGAFFDASPATASRQMLAAAREMFRP